MKFIYAALLCLLVSGATQAQPYPEFSVLSGRSANHFSSTAFGKEFIYHLTVPNAGIMLFRMDAQATILDSISIPNSMGTLANLKDRLYFSGVEWDSNDLYRMRQVLMGWLVLIGQHSYIKTNPSPWLTND